MIRVLVVEDSPVMAEYLTHIINADPALHVIGVAGNGAEGVERARCEKPDVITMDIEMPVMNGFEATRMIMETAPAPIVVITSTLNPADVKGTFVAMEAGAVAVLENRVASATRAVPPPPRTLCAPCA
ncbi:MAG: response regulator [bacterium]|nr:response regulator [bacterium]